jgi:ferredoxin-NADP reductase
MIIDPYTWRGLAIENIQLIAEATVAVRFKRPADYDFRAGQYGVIRVSKPSGTFVRQYSFSSAPNDDLLELLIQREPGGEVSSWFFDDAKTGDIVELSQPFGNFTPEPGTRPVLFIAGRVGIAPFMSALREHKLRPSVLYSVRGRNQVCYAEELHAIDATIISTDHAPRINAETLAPLLADQPLVYICGSKQFVDAIAKLAVQSGVAASDIRRELFTLQ